MHSGLKRAVSLSAALAVLSVAGPALADVKSGVDAWSRGDYSQAVREWEGPAATGDPDAMFNMGQAYRLGRGVPADPRKAEVFYARAAAAGHLQAADTYGLMLFQDGRREAALPYIQAAAGRGDPRSQYLLGIAYFNGDIVGKDWVRAYAYLTLANAQNLPQAAPALAQMDSYISLTQRQQAAGLAVQMKSEADAARGRALAAADLGAGVAAPASAPPTAVVGPPTPATVATSSRVPRPIATTGVSPSVVAAREAVNEASSATGTENPGEAGAPFVEQSTARTEPPAVVATVAPPRPTPAQPTAATSGPWKVQLGAFAVAGNAERLWAKLSGRSELAGRQRLLVPAGRVTKLLAGGYPAKADADDACRSLKRAGQDCIVTR